MKSPFIAVLLAALAPVTPLALGQVSLTSLSYQQDFNNLESGLPTGWSVSTSATTSSLGTNTSLSSTPALWNSSSPVFRNIASFDGSTSDDNTAAQEANTNRALGWRPSNAASRNGAVTLHLANTLGYRDFSVAVTLFTANNVGTSDQSYSFEYRVGDSGDFTSIGEYTTSAPFSSAVLSSVTLSALNDQNSSVFFRIRGTTTSGTTSLDTLGIDNFSLAYSAVPEPSTYAAILGGLTLVGVVAYRRRHRA